MKKLVSVFTLFICALTLYAQNNNEDTKPNLFHWALINNPSLKGSTGRLIVGLPAEASMICFVSRSGEAKNLYTMHGSMAKELPPGNYDVTFWGIKIPSIIIEKGKDTRLYVGILNSSVKGLWEIWTMDGQKIFSSGSPKLVALPAGDYNVKTGGAEFKTTINDGKITMFSFTAY